MSDAISFARGAPCPEALSGDLIANCTAEALRADATRILSYGTGNGYPPLREALAAEHGVGADQVFITNGSLQGFVFMLQAMLQPGDLVAVEAPTYDRALLQLNLHGMQILPIPMGEDGLEVDALAEACAAGRVPKLLYTITNFQNPSGATLSAAKRTALLELADRYGFLILEDDPYGKLRFEGEPLPGLFEMNPGGNTMFTSSFSKTVAPGLRVGYIIAKAAQAKALADQAGKTYISPSLLAEAAIHRLVADGGLPANIAKVTALMKERRDAMAAGLVHMPEGTRCTPPMGGFFMWMELPEPLSADALFQPAVDAGITYVKGTDCFLTGGERTLRLAYSGVSPAQISEGMERLGAVFAAALK
ncbi:MAG: PLP-dependent aminotransferase family protein [Thermoleophilia bacterium]